MGRWVSNHGGDRYEPEQLGQIHIDGLAELAQGEIIGVVPEWVLDLDANFLDTEECVGDQECYQNCPPSIQGHDGERHGEAVQDQGATEVDDIDKRQRRLANPFTTSIIIYQLLDVTID